MNTFVEAVKAYAVANYVNDGWDFVVECWADDEIEIEVEGATTEEEAIAIMAETVSAAHGHREEMRNINW